MCCFYDDNVSVSEDNPHAQNLHSSPIPRSLSLAQFNNRNSGMDRHRHGSEEVYRRRVSESGKTQIPACDLLHWEQTRRLEKWKKGTFVIWFLKTNLFLIYVLYA